ncbi:MAG TPA: AAA family ATPase, partial [Urbifossiella sp.]|nr:AAA family ATPase [Urbifossiella sp.]
MLRPADGGPPHVLSARVWEKLQLALDDVCDDSKDGEEAAEWRGFLHSDGSQWCWDGRLLRGAVTLLAGFSKDGKSTLLRGLLRAGEDARRATDALPDEAPENEEGRVAFLGADVGPFKALVATEEPLEQWAGTGYHRIRPMPRSPVAKVAEWAGYVRELEVLARSHRARVVVLDTWSRACGADENSARAVTRAMAHLRDLAQGDDVAVL